MTQNKAVALTLSSIFLLLAGIVVFVAYAKGASDARAAAPTYIDHILYTCQVEDVAEDIGDGVYGPGIGPDLAALMIDAGWQGFAGDHAERIYSPACVVHVDEHDNVIVKDVDGNIVR